MMTTNEIRNYVKKPRDHKKKVYIRNSKRERLILFLLLFLMLLSYPHIAYATGGGTAEQKWQQILDFILPWIGRFGGVLALWGGVELGNAWKDDDANGKAKGFKFIMAGVIIIAVSISANIFLV